MGSITGRRNNEQVTRKNRRLAQLYRIAGQNNRNSVCWLSLPKRRRLPQRNHILHCSNHAFHERNHNVDNIKIRKVTKQRNTQTDRRKPNRRNAHQRQQTHLQLVSDQPNNNNHRRHVRQSSFPPIPQASQRHKRQRPRNELHINSMDSGGNANLPTLRLAHRQIWTHQNPLRRLNSSHHNPTIIRLNTQRPDDDTLLRTKRRILLDNPNSRIHSCRRHNPRTTKRPPIQQIQRRHGTKLGSSGIINRRTTRRHPNQQGINRLRCLHQCLLRLSFHSHNRYNTIRSQSRKTKKLLDSRVYDFLTIKTIYLSNY